MANTNTTIDNCTTIKLWGETACEQYLRSLNNEQFMSVFKENCIECLRTAYEDKSFDSYMRIMKVAYNNLDINDLQPYILKIREEYFDGFKELVTLYFDKLSKTFIKSLFYDAKNADQVCSDEQTLRWLFKLPGIDRKISGYTLFKKDLVLNTITHRLSCFHFLITQFSYQELINDGMAGIIMNFLCSFGTKDLLYSFLNGPVIRNNIEKIRCGSSNILHLACGYNFEETDTEQPLEIVLNLKLVNRQMANEPNGSNQTPLQLCVKKQTIDGVKMLLNTKLLIPIDYNINHLASSWILKSNYDVVKLMFLEGLFDKILNKKSCLGETILHAIVTSKNSKCKRIITDILSSVELTDETIESKLNDCTFMHYVCKKNYADWEEVLGYILDSGRVGNKFFQDFMKSIMFIPKAFELYNRNALEKLCDAFCENIDNFKNKMKDIEDIRNIIDIAKKESANFTSIVEANENDICKINSQIQYLTECVGHWDFLIDVVEKKHAMSI